MLYHKVNATEVIDGLHNVVYVDGLLRHANGVGLKDVTSLLMRQSATFYMVGVIGQVYLCLMIDASFHSHLHLLSKGYEQR